MYSQPSGASGVHKFIEPFGQNAAAAQRMTEFTDVNQEALAIIESQFINYRSRSSFILGSANVDDSNAGNDSLPRMTRVYATGGASVNRSILPILADIMNAPVCKNVEYDRRADSWNDAQWNSCSVGMAYKARWGWEREIGQGSRRSISFEAVIDECRAHRSKQRGSRGTGEELEEEGIRVVATPSDHSTDYEGRVGNWRELEHRAVQGQ